MISTAWEKCSYRSRKCCWRVLLSACCTCETRQSTCILSSHENERFTMCTCSILKTNDLISMDSIYSIAYVANARIEYWWHLEMIPRTSDSWREHFKHVVRTSWRLSMPRTAPLSLESHRPWRTTSVAHDLEANPPEANCWHHDGIKMQSPSTPMVCGGGRY